MGCIASQEVSFAGGRLACRLFKVEQLRLKTTLVKLKNPMKMENNRVSVVRLCQRTHEKAKKWFGTINVQMDLFHLRIRFELSYFQTES